MTESEEFVELNRLISGELTRSETLDLMRRMLREPELRAAFEELGKVDETVRAARLAELAPGEGEALDGGRLRAERRQQQIAAILQKTCGTAQSGHSRPRTSRLPTGFWYRIVAPAAVAAAVVVAGVWLSLYLPEGQFRPAPIGPERVASLKQLKANLGQEFHGARSNVAVIIPAGEQDAGAVEEVTATGVRDVAVRVTVVRIEGDERKPWAVDALIPRGAIVELVAGGAAGWHPESVKVGVGGTNGERLPLTINARLTAATLVAETVKIDLSQPERVAEVRDGEVRFEIYVQAELTVAGQVM